MLSMLSLFAVRRSSAHVSSLHIRRLCGLQAQLSWLEVVWSSVFPEFIEQQVSSSGHSGHLGMVLRIIPVVRSSLHACTRHTRRTANCDYSWLLLSTNITYWTAMQQDPIYLVLDLMIENLALRSQLGMVEQHRL